MNTPATPPAGEVQPAIVQWVERAMELVSTRQSWCLNAALQDAADQEDPYSKGGASAFAWAEYKRASAALRAHLSAPPVVAPPEGWREFCEEVASRRAVRLYASDLEESARALLASSAGVVPLSDDELAKAAEAIGLRDTLPITDQWLGVKLLVRHFAAHGITKETKAP